MQPNAEILPAEIPSFELPPGLELPANIVLDECEAARFLREPQQRLRMRRFDGSGPAFIKVEGEPWAARYLVWDLLSWLCRHRRAVMPETPRRGSRKAAAQAAA
ncbi:hypothetical protein FV242_27095 [Methylobacterium sp. WL64]|uniref:hypothetical protein n=1 Tax=Methylobacterium sp. WL64 TaxID=2603894 RepID=UPI0011C9E07E|nr:hypothetical protein [Methylobacterium sp. WL64]TXM98959.1 hypothetical protein FV242_27095 [Methylobacterium sp. WL64]